MSECPAAANLRGEYIPCDGEHHSDMHGSKDHDLIWSAFEDAREAVYQSGLRVFAALGCEHFTMGDCRDGTRAANAKYGADQMCAPCIALTVLVCKPLPEAEAIGVEAR